MMNPIPFYTALLFGVLISFSHADNALMSRFELMREIDGAFSEGEQGKVAITDDLFGQSRNFPNDVRIFDAAGKQWPYFLHLPSQTAKIKSVNPKTRNESFVEGRDPYQQFELVIPKIKGKAAVHNRLEIISTGKEFIRRVEVFTAEDRGSRGRLAEGYLIGFSRHRNASNRSIRYPVSDIDRLYVRVYSNAKDAGEAFEITSVHLHYRDEKSVKKESVNAISVDVPDREKEKNATTHLFDVGEVARPVEFITFGIKDESFARCVSIFGRDEIHEPWQWVGGGEIHALSGDVKKTIKLNSKKRFLKVNVFHFDDQPLQVESILFEALPRYFIFEAASAGTAGVYFRAWDSKPPRYDLKSRLDSTRISELNVYELRDAQVNPLAKSTPFHKYARLLGGLAVGAVSLVVIWVIASMLRQQSKETTHE